MPDTRERWRHRLPHWEVSGRPHFVTIRCAGTLPPEIAARLREVHTNLQRIPAASPQFAALQRQYFLTCEKFLDRGSGFSPFREPPAADIVLDAWNELEARTGWAVPQAVVMPNHVHFIATSTREDPAPLRGVLRDFKGRVARAVNLILGRTGAFWQADWFDRWIRNDAEETRIVDYIRQNPVKAGLVADWRDWPFTRSNDSVARSFSPRSNIPGAPSAG